MHALSVHSKHIIIFNWGVACTHTFGFMHHVQFLLITHLLYRTVKTTTTESCNAEKCSRNVQQWQWKMPLPAKPCPSVTKRIKYWLHMTQTLPCWCSSLRASSIDSTYYTNIALLAQLTRSIKHWLHVWHQHCPTGAAHSEHQALTPHDTNLALLVQLTQSIKYWLHVWHKHCPAGTAHSEHQELTPHYTNLALLAQLTQSIKNWLHMTQTLPCWHSSLRASSIDSTYDTNLALLAQLTQSIKHWLHVWHKPCPAGAAHSEHQALTPRMTQTLPYWRSSLRASGIDSTYDTNLALLAQLTQSIKNWLHVWHKHCTAGAAHSEHQVLTPRMTQTLPCWHSSLRASSIDSTYDTNLALLAQLTQSIKHWLHMTQVSK